MLIVSSFVDALIDDAFYGKGLKSPLALDPATGDFQRLEADALVRQGIIDLLATRTFDRVMYEGYGLDLPDALFEDVEVMAAIIPQRVQMTIDMFEPRVSQTRAFARIVDETMIDVQIDWVLRRTGTPGNLVYPFYTQLGG